MYVLAEPTDASYTINMVTSIATDNNAMERTRRRLNSSMGSYMFKNGGGYIRYPDIKKSEHVMVFI